MSTIEDYSRIVSEDDFDNTIKYAVLQHYFHGYPEDKPKLLGFELIVPSTNKEYTHTINAMEPTFPDWSLIHKYFEENPESHHCYYPYTKDEINQMIKRLEYIRDNIEN